ncbi:alpha/beta fold hydrolase [Streptomyces sp. NPDC127110]|uniref:alpha/beta fold hydrolase n=1 Tax=Streptomyces sp. NPDC127110 TaxID=3345362 RepID=UPI00363174C1
MPRATSRSTAPTSFRAAYDEALARWPAPVDAVDVPTPYGLTRVNSCGPADAPATPLVLLPGGGATSTVWGACVAAGVGQGRRVHAVDLVGEPGLSVSAPGRAVRRVGDLTAWLDALLDGLDGLGGGPVTLAGHSYGAWIAAHAAVHAAVHRPGRFDRLVLLDPTGVFAGLRPGYVLRALPMLVRPTPARIRAFLDWETGGVPLDPAWTRLQEEAAAFPTVRPVTGPRPDLARLGGLPVEVLFAGRARCHDPGRAAAAARRALPGARVDVLPGVSHHALPLTAAGEIARRLAAPVSRRSASGPS